MFDVIIPTYKNLEELKRCVQAFGKQTYRNFRILVCVDGPSEGVLEYLSTAKFSFPFKVLMHKGGKRKGRNVTRNLALNHLESKYLLMFDSDIVPASDLLEKHLALLERKNCISLGDVVYTNASENILADYIQARGKGKYKNGQVIPSYYLATQNVAFESQYFIQVGGQDPDMVTYGGGDIEFGYRMEKMFRLPVIYNKEAAGYAEWNKSLDFVLGQMEEFGAVNLHKIRKKYPELREVFRFDLVESKNLRSRFVRFFLRETISKAVKEMVPPSPRLIRRLLIHYLFFWSIYKGYVSYDKNTKYQNSNPK